MANKKAIILILVTLSSIIAFSALSITNLTEHSNSTNIRNNLSLSTAKLSKTTNYSQHNPINITTNAEFRTIAISGNGSSTNPYLIANLIITNCNSNKTGITVQNTNKYFVLRNIIISGCLTGVMFSHVSFGSIINSNVSNYGLAGILLQNSINNTLDGNTVTNDTLQSTYYSRFGIGLENFCNYNSIINNNMNNSDMGIAIFDYSNHNYLMNNIVSLSNYAGYQIYNNSNDNTLVDNFANNSYIYGFHLNIQNYFNILINNTATNDEYGFSVTNSNNTILKGNIGYHNSYGFEIFDDFNIILRSNVGFNNGYDYQYDSSTNTTLINNEFISYQYIPSKGADVTGYYNSLPLLNYQSIIAIIVLIGTCLWLGYNCYIFKKTKKEIGKLEFYFDQKNISGIFSFLDIILVILTVFPSNSIFQLSSLSTILLLGGGFITFLGFLIYLFGTSVNYGKIAETFSLVGFISQVIGFILSIIVIIDINNSINNIINSKIVSGLNSYQFFPNIAMIPCFIGLIFGLGTYYLQRREISEIIHILTLKYSLNVH